MDDLWFEDELEPLPDTVQSESGGTKRPVADRAKAARSVVRAGQPKWQRLGHPPLSSGQPAVLWLVRLRYEFEPWSRSPFARARCEAYLESVGNCEPHPSVYDLYPQNLYEGNPQTVRLKFEPTLKVVAVEASVIGGSADIRVGRIVPVVVGYSGEQDRAPHWELRPKEHAIEGQRDFWLVLEQPRESDGIRLRSRVEGIVQTRWGPIAVYPKERVWISRPSVVIV